MDWSAISFSRGTSSPRDQICVSCIGRWSPQLGATRKAHIFCMFLQEKSHTIPVICIDFPSTRLLETFLGSWDQDGCPHFCQGASVNVDPVCWVPHSEETWLLGLHVASLFFASSPWGVGYTSDLLSYGIVFCHFVHDWKLSDWGPKAFFLLEIEFGTWGYMGTCCSLQKAICPQVLLDLPWWVSLIHASALFCGVCAPQGEWSSGWGLDEPPLPIEVLL